MNGKVYLEAPEIIKTVSNYFHITPEQAICTVRKREFIKVKHIAMYCFRIYTNLSLAKIGEFFNGKDHATVLHAIHSVLDQYDVYPTYRTDINKIILKLNGTTSDEFERYKNYQTENV